MKIAYLDTSCLVALVFDEPEAKRIGPILKKYDRHFSANLLEAELAAFAREKLTDDPSPLLEGIWGFIRTGR